MTVGNDVALFEVDVTEEEVDVDEGKGKKRK